MNNIIEFFSEVPTVGPLIKKLTTNQSLIAYFFIAILIIIAINMLFKSLFDKNLITSVLSIIKGKSKEEKYAISRKNFYSGSTKKDFVKWQEKILIEIYEDLPLTKLFNKTHLSVVHKASNEMYYPFENQLKHFGDLKSTEIPSLKLDRMQKHYFNILKDTIKRPNQVGFELDEYFLNDKNEITGFSARSCQYKHSVLTSHILEYELFKTYKRLKSRFINPMSLAGDNILKNLPRRKKIHENQSLNDLMIKGDNRHSLLSVQMIIVAYSKKRNKYCTLIFKRSDKVALKPNYYHIVPAGGYEIFEQEDTTHSYIIRENFDIELALFRELIEEIFNGKDFEGNDTGEINDIIYKHPDVVDIINMLEKKTAYLQFLGNVTDLMTLRQELSFLLLVDDPDFLEKNFKPNFEGKDLQIVPIEDLHKFLSDELLYPSSSGLLDLMRNSPLIKERGMDKHIW